ncbi:expressed unknown protein [Seminavis robusta]|uniref:Lectin n=1 Tax=Seminavis robusta TaxID=568900 RepID=A0A9N8HBR4_9STRA|nr:expressed unknown protein [Seminavis robusta]|eukprot:Sro270_g104200.1 n/a (261) ;mRNA; r:21604-22386
MAGVEIPNVGGVYTDPNHAPTKASANLYDLKDPWFGGIRVLGRTDPASTTSSTGTDFVCIGCDDGIHWWTLTGTFNDLKASPPKVTMDFTPKAPGVGLLQCAFESTSSTGSLHFYEEDGTTIGNTWARLTPTQDFDLQTLTKHPAFNDVNGLYVDTDIYKPGTNFAGIRLVSDRIGKFIADQIAVIGTDDGVEWWAIQGGTFVNRKAGEIKFHDDDYKIKNNHAITQAKIRSGTLHLTYNGKETKWTKMAPKMDIHALPK